VLYISNKSLAPQASSRSNYFDKLKLNRFLSLPGELVEIRLGIKTQENYSKWAYNHQKP
jgi:hypothetical protein